MGVLNNNIRLLKAMNEVVLDMNDEYAYESWILCVPDEATEEDFEFIAGDDDEMDHVCKLFRSIISHYGKSGWFTNYSSIEEISKRKLVAYGEDE